MVCMHRVNPKKRQAFLLRIGAYALTLTLSVITTVLLLYVALGYRFDSNSGQVVRSGLLLVENRPQAARIYIDEALRDNAAPGRFVLSAGKYLLRLEQDGYRKWQKNISIGASAVRNVTYPLLIPETLKSESIGTLASGTVIDQTRDRKSLLFHASGSNELTLITLDQQKVSQKAIPLDAFTTRENGMVGVFKLLEWSLDGKKGLLLHTLPSGKTELISLHVAKSEESINLTRLYGERVPSDVHYANESGDAVYGLYQGELSRYTPSSPEETTTLVKNVRSYQPYGDKTLLFDRTSSDGGEVEVGVWRDTKTTVVHRTEAATEPHLLAYASYDDHFYFSLATPNGSEVVIYRDPLEKSTRTKLTPFITLPFANPQLLQFGGSSQFLLIQNSAHITTYDFEDFKQYKTTLDYAPHLAEGAKWLTSHHVMIQRQDGTHMLMDYDGTNQQELVSTNPGEGLYFSGNYQLAYRLTRPQDEAARSLESILFVPED